ncbi:MAG: ComEC family competence protein [Bacteroidales bacterium]|nr:ComEC family competence protein [Bacteroidales bacterium]
MTHYSNIPLVRIIIPVITGIILFTRVEYYFSLSEILSAIIIFLLASILIEWRLQQHFSFRFAFGLNVMFFMVFAGYLLAQGRYEKNHPDHFSNFQYENSILRIGLIEPVSEKTNTYQIVGRATHIISGDTMVKVKGKLIAYLEKDSLSASLNYGDIIFIENNIQEVRPPQNPNAFNFKNFLANQNIFHQVYRRSGHWYQGGGNEGNIIVSFAHQMRQKALETLETNNISGREFSVASALLLGYRDYLDEDLQREFAGAGAMHILCVSGLHVGIIFLALNILLGFLKKLPRGRIIKTMAIIILIWFYAAITGFSPSVMRASTMFSFVAVGQSFSRSTNIYNTLAASALFLVILDPFIITRIGFQLSYIAVISIVWLQPMFYKLLYFKNPLLDYSWGIITVSLAAQLGTGPLALYYFNQFPNYFLLTNLAVIPLTGLIIKTGIFFFIISPISFLSQIAGTVLSFIVLVLHNIVRIIEGLPGSVSMNVFITFHETLFIFGLIAVAGMFWVSAKKPYAFAILLTGLLLSISLSMRHIKSNRQQRLVVYQVPNGSAIDFFNGKSCYFLACETTLSNPRNLSFHVNENRLRMGTAGKVQDIINPDDEKYIADGIYKRGPFIYFAGQTIKIIQPEDVSDFSEATDGINYLVLSGNPRISIEKLNEIYPGSSVIIDSSNSFRNSQRWAEECEELGIDCWPVRERGAFELAIR